MRFRMTTKSLVMLAAVLATALSAAAVDAPQGVSPGAFDRVMTIADECPTFNWQGLDRTVFYELVVYQLADDAYLATGADIDLRAATEVVYARVPGGATGWTPSLEQCLNAGGRFAWFVHAVFDADAGEVSEWSEVRLFSVAAMPSAEDVRNALGVLQRYADSGHDLSEGLNSPAGRTPESLSADDRGGQRHLSNGPTALKRGVPAGTAAIRGEHPDPSGETYGILGVSASPDGAGFGAANLGGGPDLVLDGSADGTPDAFLRESGVDRPSASSQTFAIGNSLGGGITLEVGGVEVVTTANDRDTLAALVCAGDEVAKWNGTSWTCAPDVDTDTDTLAVLGPVCDSDELARWNGGSWRCSPDEDSLATIPCVLPGSIAKWNGSAWVCGKDDDSVYAPGPGLIVDGDRILIDPAAFSKRISTLDSDGEIYFVTSLAIGSDGLGVISYHDDGPDDLKVAHCDNPLCTSATISTIDHIERVGRLSSIAIGADDLGLIAFRDDTNLALKVAHCEDFLCTAATLTTLDSTGESGYTLSLVIGADDLGLISYRDNTNSALKVAHCDDVLCTSATTSTIDAGGDVGTFTSLVIGADGLGLISYRDYANRDLKVAHCDNVLCTSATLTTVDSIGDVGLGSSLAIGADGLGLISYVDSTNHDLKVVRLPFGL